MGDDDQIHFRCGACEKRLRAPVGRRVRCPACGLVQTAALVEAAEITGDEAEAGPKHEAAEAPVAETKLDRNTSNALFLLDTAASRVGTEDVPQWAVGTIVVWWCAIGGAALGVVANFLDGEGAEPVKASVFYLLLGASLAAAIGEFVIRRKRSEQNAKLLESLTECDRTLRRDPSGTGTPDG